MPMSKAAQSVQREKRVAYLAKHYIRMELQNYPWGLSRTVSEERVKRYNREHAIFRELQKEKLLSPHTQFHDVNINNLVIDARREFYRLEKEKKKRHDNTNREVGKHF